MLHLVARQRLVALNLLQRFGRVQLGLREVTERPLQLVDDVVRDAAARAAVDRDEFAEDVALADHQMRLLALILQILRREADRREWIDFGVVPDFGPAVDDGGLADAAVRADADVGSDAGVRRDRRTLADRRPRIDERGRMDGGAIGPQSEPQHAFGHRLNAAERAPLPAAPARPPPTLRPL